MAIRRTCRQTPEETDETERPRADERAQARALLVTVIFDGAVLAARYLDGRRDRRGFVLGSGAGVDLPCADELLPAARHALVRWRRGRFEIALPDGLAGSYRERGGVVPLRVLRERGLLIPAEGEPGVSVLELAAAAELEVTLGLLRIVIAAAAPTQRLPPAPLADGSVLGPLLGPVAALSLLASMGAALIAAMPPSPVPLLRLHAVTPLRTVRLALLPPGRPEAAAPRLGEGAAGHRALLRELAPHGDRTATATAIARGSARPGRQPGAETQALGDGSGSAAQPVTPRALLASLTAGPVLGAEATAALDGLQPGAPADAHEGAGRLVGGGSGDPSVASTGIERTGRTDDRGEGRLAPSPPGSSSGIAGEIATCGELPCNGSDHGTGQRGAGTVSRRARGHLRELHDITLSCGCSVRRRGEASRELIRRTVRLHENEVRFCYERALISDPTLAGRVGIRFSLDPSGAVIRSELADTTLPGREVGACIAEAIRRWRFPPVDHGGELEVHYPFQLTTD
ncbi:MAG: AgmX/PglI C-terminal domain-containing protein [Polyangia bacterium]